MPKSNKRNFRMMSLIHETLYSLVRDPYRTLADAGLQTGQAVLEVGCGPGFFTIPAARTVGGTGTVLALDINPFAVEHVQRKIEREGASNAGVILADAAQTSLPGGSFDLAFLFGLPRPIGDLVKIWNEIHRLLKPAGVLAVEGRRFPPSVLFHPLGRRGGIYRYLRVEDGQT